MQVECVNRRATRNFIVHVLQAHLESDFRAMMAGRRARSIGIGWRGHGNPSFTIALCPAPYTSEATFYAKQDEKSIENKPPRRSRQRGVVRHQQRSISNGSSRR